MVMDADLGWNASSSPTQLAVLPVLELASRAGGRWR
jgi:hypothetical protein